ncbi:iron complex outermembrane receptor protein [Pontibacter ummariensis]|uniref:Iron complex outermembrane recepter protein n=1 Tax=Pontibacter ummariensis TaxID=1610492 RepID=A0A239CY96_9BACT|nr:TonB-dependent receptor [Pontibacter ummariensis]PRY14768.1 iron complex outermembrane receptor protein [Pontibacter ummariensis]SNS24852.1 iron complex outermembrane recepter protein [Pontibacter ummariensis]
MKYLVRLPVSLFLFFVLVLLPEALMAQLVVSGQVVSAGTEQPLQGVTVTASTGEQTISNEQGRFSLAVPAAARHLRFSSLGYRPLTVPVPLATQEMHVKLLPEGASLQEVVITGYETNRPLLETAGALSLIEQEVLDRFDQSSIVRAVNTVPGVRMEERAPASYRLSIRGSTLRSPYGIRNVKVYYDGVPFTEANGTTALNLLDAANIGRIEVLKGPTASIYGAGTGGTVLLEPRRFASGEKVLEVGTTAGSYGFRRYAALVGTGTENASIMVQYTRQQYDGYREQSAIDRDVLLISSEFRPSEKRTVGINVLYSDLYYELPGGLTLEQYAENPRQARGGTFGSVAQNASLDLEGINIGLKQAYKFSDSFRNNLALYGLHKFKDNPFNTDYERNTNQEFGGRTSFVYNTNLGSVGAIFTVGAEFQRGFEVARTYNNNGGEPGALRTDDEVVAKTGFVFAQTELELPADFIATAAISLNDTRYEITRLHQIPSGGIYQYNRNFEAVLSPRVALLKKLTEKVSAYASVSSGFSPPTEEEILTSDGSLNDDLEAEKGTNYELGIRGFALADKFSFDVVAFYFRLKETIVSRQDVSSVAVFRNVGSTDQKGLEVSLGYTVLDEPEQVLNLVKAWGSYTYSHFRFDDYQKDETDLSGNALTGAAPNMATVGLDLNTKPGFYLRTTANYVDEIPLDDENTVYADSYIVLGARTGFRHQLWQRLGLEVFAGVDNLTDEKYSLGNDLNAFGGRFFQPAPARNYYGGLNLGYNF